MVSVFRKRELENFTFSQNWLDESMLFIAGPRQCGKTTLVRNFLEENGCGYLYYNWDIEKIRKRRRNDPDFFAKDASTLKIEKPYIVFDEIHKLSKWKNILKGIYDEYNRQLNIIVTGSARLDLFRRSGDSLVGRYTMSHLFPFSLKEFAELTKYNSWLHEYKDWDDPAASFYQKITNIPVVSKDIAEAYFKLGPFPFPLLSSSEQRSRKWHRDYITLIVREDLRDLSEIRELEKVAHLVELLPDRVGSPLSLRSIGEDLSANHTTIKNWLNALKKLYLVWPLYPHSVKINRTLRKEPKWYFLDWTFAGNKSKSFENMIGTSLYRFVKSLDDRGWPQIKLHFFRTYDKKEVDFILTKDNTPILAIEAKLGNTGISGNLKRLRSAVKKNFPILQVVDQDGVFLKKGDGDYLAGYDRLQMIL